MHFSSLLLTLTAATAASAFYYPTFFNLNGATEAPDYLTYKLVPTVYGKMLAVYSFGRCLFVIVDCFLACDSVSGCGFVNSEPLSTHQYAQY
jgi:hypothetical protein